MEIKLTEKDYCKFKVDCVLLSEKVKEKKEEVLKHFSNAPCPGFRKGKASREAILTYYKSQLEESLKKALAEDAFHSAIFEKNLKPLGSPGFSSLFLKDGKFYCSFLVDVRPEFELLDVKNISIPKPATLPVEDVLNAKLEELRHRFGTTSFLTENDFVEKGDTVIVDYESKLDGVRNDTLSSESDVLELGKTGDADFTDNLLGMKLGETREFKYTPRTGSPSLKDHEFDVTLTLKNASRTVPCALDDDLAKKLNKNTFEELRDHVNKISLGIVNQKQRAELLQKLSAVLVESHDIKVQDWLVRKEAAYLVKSAKLDWSTLSEEDRSFWESAGLKNIKLSFILDKIRDSEPEAQLTDQEVLSEVKRVLGPQLRDDSNEALAEYLANMGHYSNVLFAKIKDEYALNFVLKHVKVVE